MAKELLENIYLFKGLPADEIHTLSRLATFDKFLGGQTIFSQGDKSTALYVVKYGSVQIHHNSPHGEDIIVATLGTGSHFGEMSFLDGKKRTGSATAVEDCEILRLDFSKLSQAFTKNPIMAAHFYKAMALFLAGRLETTTKDLSFAREKNLKAA